jgi:hypothetical protein
MITRSAALLLIFILIDRPVHAEESSVVEAVGEAEVKGSEVEAKKLAIADALKRCIESRLGVYVRSTFSAEQSEETKKGFDSKVNEAIVQKAEGFVAGYEIVDQKIERGVLRVKVRARVYESKLESELKRLGELAASVGGVKIAVAIEELKKSGDGKVEPLGVPLFSAQIGQALKARGLDLSSAPKLDPDRMTMLQRAREGGASVLVTGRIEIENKGAMTESDTAGLEALKGQMRIQVKGVIEALDASTGDIVSTKAISLTAIGTDEDRALQRAFSGKGQNATKQVMDALAKDLEASLAKSLGAKR